MEYDSFYQLWNNEIEPYLQYIEMWQCITALGIKPFKDGNQWCFLYGDNIQEGICGFGNTIEDALYAFLKDLIASRGEQKPTDKVEPKLKIEVNKWYICISQYCNCIEGRCYMASADGRIIDDFGTEYDMHSDAYKYFRLWTIADAKDGDVLFAENFDNIGGCVFLFKGLDSWKFDAEGDRFIATGYCCTSITESGNTDFEIQGPDCVEIKRVHPASKEQRDALMKAMADAGYTFDFESKELRKIEQYTLIPSEDDIHKWGDNILNHARKVLEQNTAEWSEEDENRFNNLIFLVEHSDENKATKKGFIKFINRLKSLKPNKQWEPSDEQMDALHYVTNFDYGGHKATLVSLYEQLKKLKG